MTGASSSGSSACGNGDHAHGAGDLDIVARGHTFVARGLQPHVVAYIAEALLVEGEFGGPAFQMDARVDARRTVNFDLRRSTTDPYWYHHGRNSKVQADHALSALHLQPDEVEIAQFGGEIIGPALNEDAPWDG